MVAFIDIDIDIDIDAMQKRVYEAARSSPSPQDKSLLCCAASNGWMFV